MTNSAFTDDQLRDWLGQLKLTPSDPVVAGSMGQWVLTLTVGSLGIDEGGTILIAQRFASDWGTPQFADPQASGYTTIRCDGSAILKARPAPKSMVRPWRTRLAIDVLDGSLRPGDQVVITLGDRSGGGPGIRAQTFQETAHEFRVAIDPTNAALVRRHPDSPMLRIIPGEPVRLVVQNPSRAMVNTPAPVFVKGEDAWGNPTPAPADLNLEWTGDVRADFSSDHQVSPRNAGTGRVRAKASGMQAEGNPMVISAEAPSHGMWWADLHAQSDSTVGTGSEEEYFNFAKEWARVDVCGHQGNDFQLDEEKWKRINDAGEASHQDGSFVVIPGYEWSGNTWSGGDRNVWFKEPHPPIYRSCHWQVPLEAVTSDSPAHPADVLFARLFEKHGEEALVGSHVGGRYADIRTFYDERVCGLIEVCSCWGIFEWMIADAVEKGYCFGIMANSDGHKGRPGAEAPGAGKFGIAGGLTCILAPQLTRDSIFEALRERRTYGTTGERILIDATLDGNPMGALLHGVKEGILNARILGTAPLESVEIFQGLERIQRLQPPEFADLKDSRTLRISWRGARHRGRGRRVDWSGRLLLEGAELAEARTFGFDSPADGILEQDRRQVRYRSQTTGDTDGIELVLTEPPSPSATLTMKCPEGEWTFRVGDLEQGPAVVEVGPLERTVEFRRHPDEVITTELALQENISSPSARSAIWLRVVQTDGHMAWTSPFFLNA